MQLQHAGDADRLVAIAGKLLRRMRQAQPEVRELAAVVADASAEPWRSV